jgi:ribosomal protein S10
MSLTKTVLANYKNYVLSILKLLNINFKVLSFPKKTKTKTLLKSPHITKKAKESFRLTIFRFAIILNFNPRVIRLLRTNIPNTVHFKCTFSN